MGNRQPSPLISDLHARIAELERSRLCKVSLPRPDFSELLSSLRFVRITGVAHDTCRGDAGDIIYPDHTLQDVVTGLHASNARLAFVISGSRADASIIMGVGGPASSLDVLKSILLSKFKGARMQDETQSALVSQLNGLPHCICVTGVPTVAAEPVPAPSPADRMIRAMQTGDRWAYVVLALPEDEEFSVRLRDAAAAELRHIRSTYLQKATGDEFDRLAQHYAQLLEGLLDRLVVAHRIGLWRVSTYLLGDPAQVDRLAGVIRSVLAGPASLPDPIRVIRCGPITAAKGVAGSDFPRGQSLTPSRDFETLLHSIEVGRLVSFPTEEASGFRILDAPDFDVDADEGQKPALSLGYILRGDCSTGKELTAPLDALNRHVLIVGTTGSGKTNTCFYLLEQLWTQHEVPFLVIEPAKTEYRCLLRDSNLSALLVFTLGEARGVPFRINPFEVEDGGLVQKHIDYILSLFNAAFVLYPPMPYVLEQAVHEIYIDKGWNLAGNFNPRGAGPRSFPTLTDLARKIDEVVDRLGYEQRLTMDVKAGLRARFDTMRMGAKGLVLDTRVSTPFPALMKAPTVLELSHIGDEEQKAFLMGLILLRIYEFWEVQGSAVGHGLRHVTVVEEAHRLIENVAKTMPGAEVANPRGKAIEAFANLLSEIRAYGEGIIIAEQIPSKLAVDAIKNTSTKILHRTVAEDDRTLLGDTMNLSDAQKSYVLHLPPGRAAIHSEGFDRPFLTAVPAIKPRFRATPSDADLRQAVIPRLKRARIGLLPDPDHTSTGSNVQLWAMRAAEDPAIRRGFRRWLLTILEGCRPTGTTSFARDVVSRLRASTPPLGSDAQRSYRGLVLSLLTNECAERLGRAYSWPFPDEARFSELVHAVAKEVSEAFGTKAYGQIDTSLRDKLTQLRQLYDRLTSGVERPYSGCNLCRRVCRYRLFAEPRDVWLEGDRERFTSVLRDRRATDDRFWRRLAELCLEGADSCVDSASVDSTTDIVTCYGAQVAADLFKGWHRDQIRFVKNVLRAVPECRAGPG